MKKVLVGMLALVMCLGMVSCSKESAAPNLKDVVEKAKTEGANWSVDEWKDAFKTAMACVAPTMKEVQALTSSLQTKEGEAADSRHLTLDVDSINYDPARHVIYLPQSLKKGYLNIYSTNGELVKRIPVSPTNNVVVLPDDEFTRGALYLVKYMPEDKMGRKNPWIKIIFQ